MAGTRLSGLMSGMDTESIIEQMVEGRRKKVDTVKKTQKKVDYKQNAWKDLNSKLKTLQSKFVAEMRFSTAYAKKTTKVSDSSAASVITGEKATNGVQTLEVKKLAKTAYLTGGVLGDGKQGYTALSTMEDLRIASDDADWKGAFTISKGGETLDIEINKSTTISDVLTKIKGFGLNANFDEKNQRFFISAKESGEESNFNFAAKDTNGGTVLDKLGLVVDESDTSGQGATKIDGTNAEILLNGALFKNSNNVFEINGLTITALNETKTGESVTITTQDDTDGIYDLIKNFIKEYNSVINELDKLYNAKDNKLEPLTDDEKYSMSDKEVEEWEDKLKESILRKDENVNSIASALKKAMLSGVKMSSGENMYLSQFGISTLNFFSAPDNEKNAYHIDGDSDDENTSGNADKLKSMIANDPSTVIEFFSKLSQNLYSTMNDLSKSVEGYRSFGSFYDDKRMKTDYDSYNSKIKEMEDKLNDYEDRWYKKFSRMETAMAKMQKNTSAVTALIGGQY